MMGSGLTQMYSHLVRQGEAKQETPPKTEERTQKTSGLDKFIDNFVQAIRFN